MCREMNDMALALLARTKLLEVRMRKSRGCTGTYIGDAAHLNQAAQPIAGPKLDLPRRWKHSRRRLQTNSVRKDMRGQGTIEWSDASKASVHTTPVGENISVHFSAIKRHGYESMDEGEAVEFEVTKDPKPPRGERYGP
jgi:cold shock protein